MCCRPWSRLVQLVLLRYFRRLELARAKEVQREDVVRQGWQDPLHQVGVLRSVQKALDAGLQRIARESHSTRSMDLIASIEARLRAHPQKTTGKQPLAVAPVPALLARYRSSAAYASFCFGGELELQLIAFGSADEVCFTWTGAESPLWFSTFAGTLPANTLEAFLYNPGSHWNVICVNGRSWLLHGPDAPSRVAVRNAAASVVRRRDGVIINSSAEFQWTNDDEAGVALPNDTKQAQQSAATNAGSSADGGERAARAPRACMRAAL